MENPIGTTHCVAMSHLQKIIAGKWKIIIYGIYQQILCASGNYSDMLETLQSQHSLNN